MFLLSKIPSNYQSAFEARVHQVVANLGMTMPKSADYLMALMDLESGLSASIKNKIGCVGLIQFCPDSPGGSDKTIGGNKVSLSHIQSLSPVAQLDYVEQYLRDQIRAVGYIPQSFVDLYMLVLLPAGIKFGYDEPIFVRSVAYMDSVKRNNPAFVDANGNITKSSIEAVYKRRYAGLFEAIKEIAKETVAVTGKIVRENRTPVIIGGTLLLLAGLLLIYYKTQIHGK